MVNRPTSSNFDGIYIGIKYAMHCQFASNGLAIDYFGTVKPCCIYRTDQDYRNQHHVGQINLMTWHQSRAMTNLQSSLAQNLWPPACSPCKDLEEQGRGDSVRLNGISAYDHYGLDDITLEIRGGATCNFACQTCWPQASSRVAQYYRQSKITFAEVEGADWQFDLLLPIKHRIKDIVLLGGEPFYDKRCRTFLQWSLAHGIQAKLTVFTNGSVLDRQFVQDYPGRLVLVFSVDAIDRPAEYIRFGTNWSTVRDNYLWARNLTAVETRVNITTSPYNYPYLYPLLSWLAKDWPTVVSFGPANQSDNSPFMDETVIPLQSRQSIITSLVSLIDLLDTAEIEPMQKANAINAIRTIATNLADGSFDHDKHQHLRDFVQKMDLAKGISLEDYCPEVAEYLDIRPGKLANTSPEFL